MYRNAEELRESEKYKYFRELGYTEQEAFVLSLIGPNDERMMLVKKDYQKHNKTGFVDYIAENYFNARYDIKKSINETKGFSKIVSPMIASFISPVDNDDEYQDEGCLDEEADDISYMPASSGNTDDETAEIPFMPKKPVTYYGSRIKASGSTGILAFQEISPEEIRTDSYEKIEEKTQRNVIDSPTATFRPTFNTAAAGIILSNIRDRAFTRHSMVRTEELLNYLPYDLKKPVNRKFELTAELKNKEDKTYLFLGVQGEKVLPGRQNICLLLDVSGSMYNNTDSIIMVAATVLSRMNPGDILSLVTYSNEDRVIINGLKLDENKNVDEIIELLSEIRIDGYTDGSAGINKAYEIIEKNMIEDGVNRVIIITDGDLNFGIHDKDGLKGLIEKKKETGAYFSAIGTGIYNLQDDKLEALAKNGNGNYFVVNSFSDVRRTIRDKYEALVYPIARNVKAQIEFNPRKVKTWKLVGYENRMLNHEDFRNDKVIAEPFGSGSYFAALFELTMNEGEVQESTLKYQKREAVTSQDIGTLTIRYEDIADNAFKEIEYVVGDELPETENIRKAIECAEIAEKLRGENTDELTRKRVKRLLEE